MGLSDFQKVLKKIDNKLNNKTSSGHSSSPTSSSNSGSYNRAPAPLPQVSANSGSPLSSSDIFSKPISSSEPLPLFPRRQHNLKPKGCSEGNESIQTNNFYNNLCLEDQSFPIWTLPYSLWFSKDPSQGDIGFSFNHTEANQRVFGPDPNSNPAQFYFNPPRIKSWYFATADINAREEVQLENHNKLSVIAKWNGMTFPLVHGMGFVTAIYEQGKVPVIGSQVGIQDFRKVGNGKYRAMLFNQVVWTIYVSGANGNADLSLRDPQHIVSDRVNGSCTIQICRGESNFYDETAGCYPISCNLSGSVDGSRGQYKFLYNLKGQSQSGKTLVWCLPHHQEVLVSSCKQTGLKLDSPTKGVMKAYVTNELVMEENNLPIQISWEPWSEISGCSTPSSYSNSSLDLITRAAEAEVKQDVVGMANIDSMYTSGKILDKFAHILFVCSNIIRNQALTAELLPKLKQAIDIFATNRQKYPLVYDTTWKGLISSADPGADFGNSNYNDHHFHYGYHIHAIALVAKSDPTYFQSDEGARAKAYATELLRDVANPSSESDKWFPQSRSFDWFHGHSFAHGIFASGDGKDEESSSEDYHFAYGMKLFGNVTGNVDMENRANLMLAIMKRSMNMYMLYSDDNKIQPPQFIKNKVAGISFENKIDYSTYFGRGTIGNEWIHGIHMLPITPISSYIRGPKFVKEEWDQILAPIIDRIPDGWKGILLLNLALTDPKKAWKWFSRNDWNESQIDNGMSRTWSLAFIAGIGGA
ncbi:endo-1,3(4)-beta-glucanase 2 [[Candida] railenensis]|uniref:glucan endo-1,3-beta-D-glucosidase n=1 Tax=[Candida] railenensis TaxID=45579 RepID=A0A9P0QUU9_9ASCO|nr:endo-1,3(4)-beta-glucanase 2 [[Candida] railenensis]